MNVKNKQISVFQFTTIVSLYAFTVMALCVLVFANLIAVLPETVSNILYGIGGLSCLGLLGLPMYLFEKLNIEVRL